MTTLDIRDNFNGKLFCDHFSHVAMYDPAIVIDREMQLTHRSMDMGVIKVKCMRTFPFSRLSDMVSFLNTGRAVQYQASLLNREANGGKTLAPDTPVMHIVVGYVQRNAEVQEPLIKDWWDTQKEKSLS